MTGQHSPRSSAARRPSTPGRRRRRRLALAVLGVTAVMALAAAACSSDDGSATTTTTTTTPSAVSPTTPTLPPDDQGAGTPLAVAWVTQVGGPGADALSAAAGRNDSVVGVGSTEGLPADPPTTGGGTKALVVEVDASTGKVRTTNEQGDSGSTVARGVASASTSGLTITCGSTDGSLGGSRSVGVDPWCAPVRPDGTAAGVVRTSGDEDEQLNGVAITDDGAQAYAVGTTSSLFPGAKDPTSGFLGGGGDALVLRLDQSGSAQWARQFGTAASDTAEAVAVTDGGDAIVTGTTDGATDAGSLGGSDGWIARMDPGGFQRWSAQFGTSAADRSRAVGVGGDPARGTETFVAAGSTRGTVRSATGTGGATNGTAAGGDDALVAAFNASGKQVWAAQLGSAADDVATGVVFDGSTVYVSGTTGGQIAGAQRIPLTPAPQQGAGSDGSTTTAPTTTAPTTTVPATTAPADTGRDGFLAALDANTGEVRWVAQFGSNGNDEVSGMTRTETGLLVLSGSTSGQLAATAPAGGTDGFLLAFTLPSTGGGAASVA